MEVKTNPLVRLSMPRALYDTLEGMAEGRKLTIEDLILDVLKRLVEGGGEVPPPREY